MSNKDNFKKFVLHKRHKLISFNESAKRFEVSIGANQQSYMPGLRRYLESVFYPDYKYVRHSNDGSTGAKSQWDGLQKGERIHEQLMNYSNMSTEQFKACMGKLDVYTAKAILYLREFDLKPMCGEISIWNDVIATRVDNISTNADKEFILIEWKTGMDDYFKRGNSTMKGVLEGRFSNCPMNQAFLQLLICKMIIEKEYDTAVHQQYVVHIKKDGVEALPIPEEMLELKDVIYGYFVYNVREQRREADRKYRADKEAKTSIKKRKFKRTIRKKKAVRKKKGR
jgi:hypothetical protein